MWREEGGACRADRRAQLPVGPGVPSAPLLFIAMAGPHQIWMLDRRARDRRGRTPGRAARRASTARSRRRPSRSRRAWPSQATRCMSPTQSRTSSARSTLPPVNQRAHARRRRSVRVRRRRRHRATPCACSIRSAWPSHDGRVVIADTYNHKIKLLDPATGKVWTLAGTGKPGQRDGAGQQGAILRAGRGERVRRHHLRRRHQQPRHPRRRRANRRGDDGYGAVHDATSGRERQLGSPRT